MCQPWLWKWLSLIGLIAFFWALSLMHLRAEVHVFTSPVIPVTAFSIADNGKLETGAGTAGWVFTYTSPSWSWQTGSAMVRGSMPTGSLGGFAVNLTENVSLVWNRTTIEPGTEGPLQSFQWISEAVAAPPSGPPVPEPASLLLLGTGWVGRQLWRRLRDAA